MRHGKRLIGEAVGGCGHVIAAQRIAFHTLHFTAADVIVVGFPNGAAGSRTGYHLPCQQASAIAGGVVSEVAGGKARSPYKDADSAVYKRVCLQKARTLPMAFSS